MWTIMPLELRNSKLIGLKGIYVDRPDAMGMAWAEALASDRPVVPLSGLNPHFVGRLR